MITEKQLAKLADRLHADLRAFGCGSIEIRLQDDNEKLSMRIDAPARDADTPFKAIEITVNVIK